MVIKLNFENKFRDPQISLMESEATLIVYTTVPKSEIALIKESMKWVIRQNVNYYTSLKNKNKNVNPLVVT